MCSDMIAEIADVFEKVTVGKSVMWEIGLINYKAGTNPSNTEQSADDI